MANEFNARLYARYRSPAAASVRDRLRCTPEEAGCSDCGSLRCLCRPRFFAGQLLSEHDLNRLDEYIREKNRLHTLQLHGWGVVNGLEVHCNPCGDGVVVGCGYAISPCGDDIIVCEGVSVDICSLIDKCCHRELACQPYRGTNPGSRGQDCADIVEDWVLALRYAERGARGVAALRSPACSCGAKASGGCGCGKPQGTCSCGTKGVFKSACSCQETSVAQPRAMPAQCEPTVTCEGYAFEVFRAPQADPQSGRANAFGGELAERLRCCFVGMRDTLPLPPAEAPGPNNHVAWNAWCCNMKAALVRYVTTNPPQNCSLVAQLQALPCPDPALPDAAFVAAMADVRALFIAVMTDVLLACLCAALLPPCPEPSPDDRVPLAVVSVRRRGCQVLSTCNWTPLRKLVFTFPTLEYWLSIVPVLSSVRELIHGFCCGGTPRSAPGQAPNPNNPNGALNMSALFQSPSKLNPALSSHSATLNATFATLVAAAAQHGALDPQALASAVFGIGLPPQTGALSTTEAENLAPFLLINQVLAPILASLSPAGGTTPADTRGDADLLRRMERLESEIATLRQNG